MQNYANCINTDNTLKNQTPRLNAKTVNANLTRKHKFQSYSLYEIQGRRQPESSGGALKGAILEWAGLAANL